MNDIPLFTVALVGCQTEPYLPKALDSIARQSFRDFDVLCVVEDSSDDSLRICQNWAQKHKNSVVVSLPRSGSASCSRNYAIDHAKGSYLVFIDGDDWIRRDMLERLAGQLAKKGDLDILAFAGIKTWDEDVDFFKCKNRISNLLAKDANEVFSGQDAIRRWGQKKSIFRGETFLNVFRTAFLRDNCLYQKKGLFMEDFVHVNCAWFLANRMVYIDEALYAYRQRQGSAITTPKIHLDYIPALKLLMAFSDTHNIPSDIMEIWCNKWLSRLYWLLFHPSSYYRLADGVQRTMLLQLKEPEGRVLLKKIAKHSSLPKQVAMPLVHIATTFGWQVPAKLFFGKLYYPISQWWNLKNR